MIAYDTQNLENQFLIDEAHSLYKAQFITEEQLQEIEQKLATTKKHKSLLLRLGFAF